MMTKRSDEGVERGLGWFDVETVRIKNESTSYKVPHMGWNDVTWQKQSKIIDGIRQPSRFYFVHSYVPLAENKEILLATCSYGLDLHVAFEQENLIGVQFHPEKSHIYGLKLIENFCKKY